MKKNQKQISNEEELRFQNEFRKLKMSLESGAKFYSNDDGLELPLEIENEFLNNVEAFEKALQSSTEVTVYEFLGKPVFKKESEIPDDELEIELEKLNNLMFEHNMTCDVIYSVDDRMFYKFITEELIFKTTKNVKVPGFMKHFIYEEFHPNHEEDIKYMCMDLIKRFFENNFNENFQIVVENCEDNYKELLTFRKTFVRCREILSDEMTLQLAGHLATVKINISFDALVNEGGSPIRYEGEGLIKLEYADDCECWCFTHIFLPGMRK